MTEADKGEFLAALEQFDQPGKDEEPQPRQDIPRQAAPHEATGTQRGAAGRHARPARPEPRRGAGPTRAFLAHAARQKWQVVLLSPQGLHSQEGPVLRREVERLLATTRDLVLNGGWRRASWRGRALAVFVRRLAFRFNRLTSTGPQS